jgi:hypothetical protein
MANLSREWSAIRMTAAIKNHLAAKTLLTEEDVVGWQAELAGLNEQVARLQAKSAELRRKLEAAAVFMKSDEPISLPQEGPVRVPQPKSSTLYLAIEKVVLESAVPMTPKMIRSAILHSQDAPLVASENYLYTAIKRLADRRVIVREDRGYVPGPPRESQ